MNNKNEVILKVMAKFGSKSTARERDRKREREKEKESSEMVKYFDAVKQLIIINTYILIEQV